MLKFVKCKKNSKCVSNLECHYCHVTSLDCIVKKCFLVDFSIVEFYYQQNLLYRSSTFNRCF